MNILYKKMTSFCSSVVEMKMSSYVGERPGRRTHTCAQARIPYPADFCYLTREVKNAGSPEFLSNHLDSIQDSSVDEKSAVKAARESGTRRLQLVFSAHLVDDRTKMNTQNISNISNTKYEYNSPWGSCQLVIAS